MSEPMTLYTIDDVLSWRPCSLYDRPLLLELWAGRDALSAVEIAALQIPRLHRIWALIRCMRDDNARWLFTADCHERFLPAGDHRVAILREFARGEASYVCGAVYTSILLCDYYGPALDAERDWQITKALEYCEEKSCPKKK